MRELPFPTRAAVHFACMARGMFWRWRCCALQRDERSCGARHKTAFNNGMADVSDLIQPLFSSSLAAPARGGKGPL